MTLRRLAAAALVILALTDSAVAQDPKARIPNQPDAGLLEFLGSVDGLSDVTADYLSQGRMNPLRSPGSGTLPARATAPATSAPASSPPLAQEKKT